jgi:hypothetical protein
VLPFIESIGVANFYFGLGVLFLVTFIVCSYLLQKRIEFVYKTGLFLFRKAIKLDSGQVFKGFNDFSIVKIEESLFCFGTGTNCSIKFEKDRSLRRKQNYSLHGVLIYDEKSNCYYLKMKILLVQLFSPLIGGLFIFLIVYNFHNLLVGFLSWFIVIFMIGLTLFYQGQIIYNARKDFKKSIELLESHLNK